jgi:hypothetical protein
MKPLLLWGKHGGVSFYAFLGEREYVKMLESMKNRLVSNRSFFHAINAEKPQLSSPIKTKDS